MNLIRLITIVCLLCPLAAASVAHAQSTRPTRAKVGRRASLEAANRKVSPKLRGRYARYWKGMRDSEATKLEKTLARIEARERRGENVKGEVAQVKKMYPELLVLSGELAKQGASCTGIGWIGKNGKLRCIGRLTT